MMNLLRWILLLIALLNSQFPCSAKSRNSTRSRGSSSRSPKNIITTFDSTFPGHLTVSFNRCLSIADEGQRGVCKISAAMDAQLDLLPPHSQNSPAASSSSCEFKSQNGKSLHRYATPISPDLNSLLDRYSRMHRACKEAEVDHLKSAYSSKKMNNLKCRYIVWSCTFGLGNKIMSLISTFLYAVLSQRVLLLDEGSSWDKLFCQPFQDSQWRLPEGMTLKDDESILFREFYLSCLKSPESCRRSTSSVQIVFAANSKAEDHRFLACPFAYSSVRDIPVLHFHNSNQYFVAGFFLNPVLRPVLETVFPDRRVFNNLAGFLLAPSDQVWDSIKHIYSGTFRNASTRIGVQLRESKGEYRDYFDSSVPRCIRWNSGMCPIEIEEFQESKSGGLSKNFFSVYVSSLVGEHSARINESLRGVERETGQRFELGSQSADEEQLDDVEHQQKALADMWMLSMADVLMTSHMSTFGYTAQGLGGLTPYLLKPWKENPCWLGVSSEPCFHFAPSAELGCGGRQDGGVRRGAGEDVFRPCPDLPNTGIQLLER